MFVPTLNATEMAAGTALAAHVTTNRVQVINAPAYAAKGKALADLAIAEARGQGSAWTRFYKSMLDLESEGRKAFRSEIAAHQKQMNAHVKAHSAEGEADNPVYATAKRSGMVRLSELTTISKALDAAVEFDALWPFHFAVGHAREALRAAGAGSTKGRKAGPWLNKVKAYLAKTVPADQWDQCIELVETLAKVKGE